MKPPRFAYHDPVTRGEALALLDAYEDEAKLLAGGQSLVPLLNMRLHPFRRLRVCLSGLRSIRACTCNITATAWTAMWWSNASPAQPWCRA